MSASRRRSALATLAAVLLLATLAAGLCVVFEGLSNGPRDGALRSILAATGP